ncbi:hypothetical protein GGI23_000020 [Coemansia sp. RSA 2559]|nr:hypothetical protein GGI23_000020 [Coemansia sp. RSA 2559]KAJ2869776.1 hypothetical protein GGI22_000018 [Coemansia erecta]
MTQYVVLVSYNDFNINFCDFVEVPVNGTLNQFRWAICEKLREAKVAFITANELSLTTKAVPMHLLKDNADFYNLVHAYNVVEIEAFYGTMLPLGSSLSECNISEIGTKAIPVKGATMRDNIPTYLDRENTLVESQDFLPRLSNKGMGIELPPPAYGSVDDTAANVQFSTNFIYTC